LVFWKFGWLKILKISALAWRAIRSQNLTIRSIGQTVGWSGYWWSTKVRMVKMLKNLAGKRSVIFSASEIAAERDNPGVYSAALLVDRQQ
jgi:hypothetical protein